MIRVVNAHREPYDVLIARPSKWGNPFRIGRDGNRDQVIKMYEVHVRRRLRVVALLEMRKSCRGRGARPPPQISRDATSSYVAFTICREHKMGQKPFRKPR